MSAEPTCDFFISYNRHDEIWAEWIAWQVEAYGYSAIIQTWDFRPGSNFVLEMQAALSRAQRLLLVLSSNFLQSEFTQPEWAAVFANDPRASEQKLVPVRVDECEPTGLLRTLVYIDLVGKEEDQARNDLLAGLNRGRAKPSNAPSFPNRPAPAYPPRPAMPAQDGDVHDRVGNIPSRLATLHSRSLRIQQYLVFAFGLAFIVVLLVIATLNPSPSSFQYSIFKVVLALAAAGVAAIIPGVIQFHVPRYVRAAGALAVFAIVFFRNPAGLVSQKVDSDFVDMGTGKDQTLADMVFTLATARNVTIAFGPDCDSKLKHTLIEAGDHQGKDIQDFLNHLRERAKGAEPAYHTEKKGDKRYEIDCP
jgi:hypothetical protein